MLGHRPLQIEDYYDIMKRRGWIVLIPVILLPIIALACSFLIAPQYLSQTLVLVESQKVPDNYVKPVISSDLDSRLASMKEQILSRSRIQPIIERYNLYGNSQMTMDDRIDLARRSITIKPITSEVTHTGGLPGFFISFKAGDPHIAQLVCGEITSLFLGENLRSREASAQGTTDFLQSQLADAKRNLDEQDAKLAAFQREYIGRLPGEEAPNVDMLTSLNTQLEAATQSLARMEQDKAYEEAMFAQQSQSYPVGTPQSGTAQASASPDQQAQLQILLNQQAELTAHYTDDYPDVITVKRKITELNRQIAKSAATAPGTVPGAPSRHDSAAVQQLRAQIHSADVGIQAKRQEQAKIQSNISMYQNRIQSSPLVEEQYKQITRDNQTAQAFYDDLLGKMNQSKMATDLEKREQGEQFHVMDEPNLPDAPFSPKRPVFALGGFVGGLALGLLIIAGLEYKDTSLRTETDVWVFTHLPTLATIAKTEQLSSEATQKRSIFRRLFRRQEESLTGIKG
jgi:polysaccharide chain length determinant protein (PEP-CTERM system associated)